MKKSFMSALYLSLSLLMFFTVISCTSGTPESEQTNDTEIAGDILYDTGRDAGKDSGCTNECEGEGERVCTSDASYKVCRNIGGCLIYSSEIKCDTNTVCKDGYCIKSCVNQECSAIGAKKCGEENNVLTCDDYNNDGCLEWGNSQKCDQNLVCSQGYCRNQCVGTCTYIGARNCDENNNVVTCGDYNNDSCLEWGSPFKCEPPLVCSQGECKTQCSNECQIVNSKKCDVGGNIVTCNDYNKDGCLEWGSPVGCEPPLVCNQGYCALSCTDECFVKDSRQCVEGTTNKYQICNDYNKDGCLEWGSAISCDGNLVCSEGNCSNNCSNTCTVLNERKCDGNGYQICGDYNNDSCLEWSSTVNCEIYQTCESGFCKQKEPPAKILINEVLYDAVGTDNDVFVELYGPPGTDLAGYFLVGLDGNGGTEYNVVTLAGKIPSDGLFVIAGQNAAQSIRDQADMLDAKVDYQNGPDNIAVRYGTITVDSLGYGDFSSAVFRGEGSPAVDVASGHSLGRDSAHTDTDNNSTDFRDFATPTPGANNLSDNIAPVAKLTCPSSGSIGQSLVFDGSQSADSDGSIVNYEFDFGDQSQKVSGPQSVVSHSFSSGGFYTVTLTVTDNGGLKNSTSCGVSVSDPSSPAVVIIKPVNNKQVTQGENVAFLIDATPSSGRSISKVELYVEGNLIGTDSSAPYEFSYTIPQNTPTNSTIQYYAKATDNQNSVGLSETRNLNVKNDPPVASFTAVVSGTLRVALDATSSTDTETQASELQVRWDFENDGLWDTGWDTKKVLEHTYPSEGTYTIKMEVKDAVGQVSSATRSVTLSLMQYVSGTVTTTTWTGTIVVTGDVVVPASNTLTIAKGTSVLFTYIDQNTDGIGDYDITINGTLKVEGTASEPVIFTVYGTDHRHAKAYNRIILNGTGTTINYAIVEYADVGLDIRDNSNIQNITIRQSSTGLRVSGSANTSISSCTVKNNTVNGIEQSAGTSSFSDCEVSLNGKDGFYITGGTANITLSGITANGNIGLEYSGSGTGQVTRNLITANSREGVRISTNGSSNPNPVINFNNIYGNSVWGSRVIENTDISVSTTASDYYASGKNSSLYQTPSSEIIDLLYYSYSEYDSSSNYVFGYVRKDSGTGSTLVTVSSDFTGWAVVSGGDASRILAQVVDMNTSYYGSMSVSKVAYDKAGAVKEAAVILTGGTVDMKHNYWGTFPNVLDVVALGHNNAANLQGFIGIPFDSSWSKGVYFGGETINSDRTFSGTVYITGDLTFASGKTLTVEEGTNVLFGCIDQDYNGTGDCSILMNGSNLIVSGKSANRVMFTQYGSSKTPRSYNFVRVYSGGTATVTYAVFEYGFNGLRLESGGAMNITNTEFRKNGSHGLYILSAGNVSGDYLTSNQNGEYGIFISSSSNVSLNHLTVQNNALDGINISSSTTSITVQNSNITNNTGNGITLNSATATVRYNNINYNLNGIRYIGNSAGSTTYNNIKYNNREGIYLARSGSGANPNPVINNNNIYGNSVVEGSRIEDTDISVSTTASDYFASGKNSAPYTTPNNNDIHFIRVIYSEYDSSSNYVFGYVRKDSGTGTVMFTASSEQSLMYVDILSQSAKTILSQVVDMNTSYYGSMSVKQVIYYEDGLVKEIAAVTDSGKVDCRNNYWGVFPDPTPRFALGRSDAIDFQGFVGSEISGTGPQ